MEIISAKSKVMMVLLLELEQIDSFKYLVRTTTSDAGCTKEI